MPRSYQSISFHSRRPSERKTRARRLLAESLEPRHLLATLTVTSTADTGPGSLRQAILDANATNESDLIAFDIPATDSGHLYYRDDGVSGQVSLDRVGPTTESGDTRIADIDPDWPHSWYSIRPDSSLPRLTRPVTIDGYSQSGAAKNSAVDRFDGLLRIELDGSNLNHGLVVMGGRSDISGLAINRVDTGHGVWLRLGDGNSVTGNLVGTDVSGTLGIGQSHGILVGTNDNEIGGTTPESRNVVSGNQSTGLWLESGSTNNKVQGNLVGTAADGISPLGNGSLAGIQINNFTNDNLVGGPDPSAGNVIAFNVGNGVNDGSRQSSGNLIQGNRIHSNTGHGVSSVAAATQILGNEIYSNTMRGISAGGVDQRIESNIITANGLAGVLVFGGPTAVLSNAIDNNAALGIDLAGGSEDTYGVTANDDLDADSGSNNLQNFPILTSVTHGTNGSIVAGTIHSEPETEYLLQFFASSQLDPSGHGEGALLLGSWDTSTDAAGVADFAATLTSAADPGHYVTATATRISIENQLRIPTATSEFSAAILVPVGDASLQGQQFDDRNGDGERDSNEEAVNGSTIELVDPQTDEVLAIRVTADLDLNGDGQIHADTERGVYQFDGLSSGPYIVRQQVPAGYRQTIPLPVELGGDGHYLVTIEAGNELTGLDFGSQVIPPDTIEWDGGGDDRFWHDPLNWTFDRVPGPDDDVVIATHRNSPIYVRQDHVTIASLSSDTPLIVDRPRLNILQWSTVEDITLSSTGELIVDRGLLITGDLTLSGSSVLGGDGDVTVMQSLDWFGGTMSGGGRTTALGGLLISGNDAKSVLGSRTIVNSEHAIWDGGTVRGMGIPKFINEVTADFVIATDGDFFAGNAPLGLFRNEGRIIKQDTFGTSTIESEFVNLGTVESRLGTLRFRQGFRQDQGETLLAGGNLESNLPMLVNGGELRGYGQIAADVFSIAPIRVGMPYGTLRVTGNLTSYTLVDLDIAGTTPGISHDVLQVDGTATIGGVVGVNLVDPYVPSLGHVYQLMTYQPGFVSATVAGTGELAGGNLFWTNASPLDFTATVSPIANAEYVSQKLSEGLASLVDWLRSLAAMYDLPDYDFSAKELPDVDIPAISDRFEDLFDLQNVIDAIEIPSVSPTTTYQQLLDQLSAADITLECISGGVGSLAACASGEPVRFRIDRSVEELDPQQLLEYNDFTPDVLPVVAAGLDINGEINSSGALNVSLVVGVDQNGFFVDDQSSVNLHVSASGDVSGSGRIGGIDNSVADGDASVELDVAIVPSRDKQRLRVSDLSGDIAAAVIPVVSGDARVRLHTDLPGDTPQTTAEFQGQADFSFSVGADQASRTQRVLRPTLRLPGGFHATGEMLSGTIEVDQDPDPQVDDMQSVPYGLLRGEFEVEGMHAATELLITEFGPAAGVIRAPLGMSLTDTGWKLGAATGELLFGESISPQFPNSILDPNQLFAEDILSPQDRDYSDPGTIVTMVEPVVQVAEAAIAVGQSALTWAEPFQVLVDGLLTHAMATTYGAVSLATEIDADVATSGIQWLGRGELNVLGLPLGAATSAVSDILLFTIERADALSDVFTASIETPLPDNPLSFLFPAQTPLSFALESFGLAKVSLLATRQFIEQLQPETTSSGGPLFQAAVELLANKLNTQSSLLRDKLSAEGQTDINYSAQVMVSQMLARLPAHIEALNSLAVAELRELIELVGAFSAEFDEAIGIELLRQQESERIDASNSDSSRQARIESILQRSGLAGGQLGLGLPDGLLDQLGQRVAWSDARSFQVHDKADSRPDVKDGDRFSVSDGQTTVEFEFAHVDLGDGVSDGAQAIYFSFESTVDSLAEEIARKIQSLLDLQVTHLGNGRVELRKKEAGQPDPVVDLKQSALSLMETVRSLAPELVRAVWLKQHESILAVIDSIGAEVFDPTLTITGEIAPVIVDIPLGRAPLEGEVTLSTQGLDLTAALNHSATLDVLASLTDSNEIREALSSLPLPTARGGVVEAGISVGETAEDRASALAAIVRGQSPVPLDSSSPDWQMHFPEALDLFGFPLHDAVGQAVSQAESVTEINGISSEAREALLQHGGIAVGGVYQLPEFLRDPLAALESLPATLPDDLDALRDSLMAVYGDFVDVANLQLFVPSIQPDLVTQFAAHTVERSATTLSLAGDVIEKAVEFALATAVNVVEDTFTVADHVLENGDPVRLISDDPPDGLRSGKTYYVVKASANQFALAISHTSALAEQVLQLGSPGSGQHQFERDARVRSKDHGYQKGDQVKTGRGDPPSPLQQNQPYYVTNVLADSYSLALSASDAVQGIAIDLQDSASGAFEIIPEVTTGIARLAFDQTKTTAELAQSLGETLANGFLIGTWNGPLLGIELTAPTVEGTTDGMIIRGGIPWLCDIETDFRHLIYPDVALTPTPAGPVPIPYPSISAVVDADDGLNLEELAEILQSWGLPSNAISAADVVLPELRVFSPLFDPQSRDPVEARGGIELSAALNIPGLLQDTPFRFALTPPSVDEVVPEFIANASINPSDLFGFANVPSELFDLSGLEIRIDNSGGQLSGLIGGTIELFGNQGIALRVDGPVTIDDDGVSGVIPLTQQGNPDAPFGLSDLQNFELLINPTSGSGVSIQFDGDLELPGGLAIDGGTFHLSGDDDALRLEVGGTFTFLQQTLFVGSGALVLDGSGGIAGQLALGIASGAQQIEIPGAAGESWAIGLPGGELSLIVTPQSSEVAIVGQLGIPGLAVPIEVSGRLDSQGHGRLIGSATRVPVPGPGSVFRISGGVELERFDKQGTDLLRLTLDGDLLEWGEVATSLNGTYSIDLDGSFTAQLPSQTLDLFDGPGAGMKLEIPASEVTVAADTFELSIGESTLDIPGFPPLPIPGFEVTDTETGQFDKTLLESGFDLGIFGISGKLVFEFANEFQLHIEKKLRMVLPDGTRVFDMPNAFIPALFDQELPDTLTINAAGEFESTIVSGTLGTPQLGIHNASISLIKDGPDLTDVTMKLVGGDLQIPLLDTIALPVLELHGDGVVEAITKLGERSATIALDFLELGQEWGLRAGARVSMLVSRVADQAVLIVDLVDSTPLAIFGQEIGEEILALTDWTIDSLGEFTGLVVGRVEPVPGVVLGSVAEQLVFLLRRTADKYEIVLDQAADLLELGFVDIDLEPGSFIDSDGNYRFSGSALNPLNIGDASFLKLQGDAPRLDLERAGNTKTSSLAVDNAALVLPLLEDPFDLGKLDFTLAGILEPEQYVLPNGTPLWGNFETAEAVGFELILDRLNDQDIVRMEVTEPTDVEVLSKKVLEFRDLVIDSSGAYNASASGALTLSWPVFLSNGTSLASHYTFSSPEFQASRDGQHVKLSLQSESVDLGFFNADFSGYLRSDGSFQFTADAEDFNFGSPDAVKITGDGSATLNNGLPAVSISDVAMTILGYPVDVGSLSVTRLFTTSFVSFGDDDEKAVDLGFLEVDMSGSASSIGNFSFEGSQSVEFGYTDPESGIEVAQVVGDASFTLSSKHQFEGEFDGQADLFGAGFVDARGWISESGCLTLTKPQELSIPFPGGACSHVFVPLQAVNNYVVGGTALFDANGNGQRDFLDLNGNSVRDVGEPIEPTARTQVDGSAGLFIPTAFDRNGDGQFSLDEGRLVVGGGLHAATRLPFVVPISAPVGTSGIRAVTPLTTLLTTLAVNEGIDIDTAQSLVRQRLDLPAVNLLHFDPVAEVAAGNPDARSVLLAAAAVQDSVAQVSALIDPASAGLSIAEVSGRVHSALASHLSNSTGKVDLGDANLLESVLEDSMIRSGLTPEPDIVAVAAEVIAAANAQLDGLSIVNDLAFLAQVSRVQRVAQGQGASDLAALTIGSITATELRIRNTGAALEDRIAIAAIGNVVPPRIAIDDRQIPPATCNEFEVDVPVQLSHPGADAITVAYTTRDGTAKASSGDYTARRGVLTFQPGETRKTISITIRDGQHGDEFFVDLYDPENAVLSGNRARIQIISEFADTDGDGVPDAIEEGAANRGDGNEDGIADRLQANVASLPSAVTSQYVTLVSAVGTSMAGVRASENPSDDGPLPRPSQAPLGFFEFVVEGVDVGGATLVDMLLSTDISFESYWQNGPTTSRPMPHWYRFDFHPGLGTGAERRDVNGDGTADVVLHLNDGGRGDNDLEADGRVVQFGGPVNLPWRNPLLPFDVNDDRKVTAIDALISINGLGRFGVRELINPRPTGAFYFDSNGDGFHTALDALVVINSLRRGLGDAAFAAPEMSPTIAPLTRSPDGTDTDPRREYAGVNASTSRISKAPVASFFAPASVTAATEKPVSSNEQLSDRAIQSVDDWIGPIVTLLEEHDDSGSGHGQSSRLRFYFRPFVRQ